MQKIIFFLFLFLIFPYNILALNDSSKSSIVMDINSGRILYQKDSNSKRLIASTTKLMTFLITVTYANDFLDQEIIVQDEILKAYGTNMYLSLNEKITIRDLLYGLILRSGNDASLVLAKNIGSSETNFVSLMNLKAQELGMMNTVFENPHGLDEETKNYSTAYDMALLIRYLYLNFPLYKEIASTKYYDFKTNLKSYSLINRSKILFNYDYITTAKNGYTPKAGKSLVTTANKNNLNLLIVTLDDPNIYENHQNLYEKYFSEYQNILLIDKNNFLISKDLFTTDYYLKDSFSYPLNSEELKKIETKIIVLEKENTLGSVIILLNNKEIHTQLIYKKPKKEKDSLFKKIKNYFQKILKT